MNQRIYYILEIRESYEECGIKALIQCCVFLEIKDNKVVFHTVYFFGIAIEIITVDIGAG